jgi:murein DD-endopeptidase MepM/ murein hydrolase activator NlpD
VPAALELPAVSPDDFVLAVDGGPIDGLAAIWRNQDFPITQEFGHTEFSITHVSWYAYGADYGLDGYEHPGIDIGMPKGTQLYSPVDGTVKIAGGVPFYTFYGNGEPGVGELLIVTDDGDEVILGHMGRIAVSEGERVEAGQFVGLSGGDNGDHLHLETREKAGGGYRIVDPRHSFLIRAIAKAAREADASRSAGERQRS